ncbi:MAG TPA: RsmB/NOP family class I SAM-dependent RNA methyltransferase [Rhabdaerophilum sp.]|nr:RsmB/NOP family class I SAM-dependent RNA methyltransferase [Rhabdaerophilum sp.]
MPPKSAGHRKPAAVPGLAARALAARALRRAVSERRSLDEALHLSQDRNDALESADFGLARAIATVTFRRMGTIRHALAARLTGEGMPEAGIFREAIWSGAAQILFMDVPDHAAVDLAVELVKSDRLALHYARLANALLRGIARDRATILEAADPFAHDLPSWMRERWVAAYGEHAARETAAMFVNPPHVDLTPFRDPAELAAAIGGTVLPTGSVRLKDQTAIPALPGYGEGTFQVQDAASALPARLIRAKAGERILDLCAAPGGKTAQLAATGAAVMSVERSAQRAERLKANLARLGFSSELVIADGASYEASPFDAVLLDAPCSATGTIRRHPEIAWTKTFEDILGLARSQRRLLDHAATLVRPGGRLVYATCSLESEEGEDQIRGWLAGQSGFVVEPVMADELGIDAGAITPDGFLRVLPFHLKAWGGVDGFFAARLKRVAG